MTQARQTGSSLRSKIAGACYARFAGGLQTGRRPSRGMPHAAERPDPALMTDHEAPQPPQVAELRAKRPPSTATPRAARLRAEACCGMTRGGA